MTKGKNMRRPNKKKSVDWLMKCWMVMSRKSLKKPKRKKSQKKKRNQMSIFQLLRKAWSKRTKVKIKINNFWMKKT